MANEGPGTVDISLDGSPSAFADKWQRQIFPKLKPTFEN